jgi:hypothetical protein
VELVENTNGKKELSASEVRRRRYKENKKNMKSK